MKKVQLIDEIEIKNTVRVLDPELEGNLFVPGVALMFDKLASHITYRDEAGHPITRTVVFTDKIGAEGFLILYKDLKHLKKDFPDEPFTTIVGKLDEREVTKDGQSEVRAEPNASGKAVLDL